MDKLKYWQMIDFLLICTVFQCHNNNLALGDSIKTHSAQALCNQKRKLFPTIPVLLNSVSEWVT